MVDGNDENHRIRRLCLTPARIKGPSSLLNEAAELAYFRSQGFSASRNG